MDARKTAGLSDLGIDIVEADLFDQASLDRVMVVIVFSSLLPFMSFSVMLMRAS